MGKKPKNATHSLMIKNAKNKKNSKNQYVDYPNIDGVNKLLDINVSETNKNSKKKKIEEPKGKEFYIMNKDAKYFCGLLGGDPMWTSDESEAKVFNDESKIEALKRHASSDKPEIIYK